MSLQSRLSFLMTGVTRAALKELGNCPSSNDMLISRVIGPASVSKQFLTSCVGRGSSGLDLGGDILMVLMISSSDAGAKVVREDWHAES